VPTLVARLSLPTVLALQAAPTEVGNIIIDPCSGVWAALREKTAAYRLLEAQVGDDDALEAAHQALQE
jgi:hypothetical protein